MIRKLSFIIFLIVISYGFSIGFVYSETVDRIVAVVNDEPITQSELDALLMPIYAQYRSAYSGEEFMTKINDARTNLLNQLIEDKLVTQEAKRLEVKVTEDEIEVQINEIKRKFPSEEEFNTFLKAQRITVDKLYKRYEEQIAIRKLHQYEVRQKVVVSPLEIEAYYSDHIGNFTEEEKLKVKTIMIKKKKDQDQKGNDEDREEIEKIVNTIQNGASFAELAKQYSQGMNAEEGGALGFIERGEMIPEFDTVLFKLTVGEISPVLETDIGYHVFLVEAKQEREVRPLSEIKDEIHNIIFKTKAKERFEKWMQELKQNAYISIK